MTLERVGVPELKARREMKAIAFTFSPLTTALSCYSA